MQTASLLVRSIAAPMLALALCRSAAGAPGTVVEWGSPVGVPDGTTGIGKITAGRTHLIGLTDEGVHAVWGSNAQSLQIPASPFGGTLTQVAAGNGKSAGLWSTGRVTLSGFFSFNSWTDVTAIAMGGTQMVARFSDGTVGVDGGASPPAGLTDVAKVAAGPNHALALKTDGTVVAWGLGSYGQTTVPVGLTGVTAIAAGEYHSLALKNDGTVVAWGAGTATGGFPHYGQSAVPSGLTGVTAIAAGGTHSVALKNDGSVVCWGDNSSGQCTVPVTLRNVQAIAAGAFFTAAITLPQPEISAGVDNYPAIEGTRVEFLSNTGTTQTRTFYIVNTGTAPLTGLAVTRDGPDAARFTIGAPPVTTLAPATSTTFTVTFAPNAAGNFFAGLHIENNGQPSYDLVLSGRTPMGAVAWGGTAHPEYGLGRLPVAAGNVVSVTAGDSWSAFARSDGSVHSWGGSQENGVRSVASAWPGGWSGAAQVAISAATSDMPSGSVLGRDGGVYEWSPLNSGRGNEILPPAAAVRRIAAGRNHGLALKGDGSIHQWGAISAMPAGLGQAQDIAAGDSHSVVLRLDGSVAAWGGNGAGQTNVPADLRAVDVAAGAAFTLTLLPDGTVALWGDNDAGRLNVPAGLNNVIAIEAAGRMAVAIKRDGSFVTWGASGAPAWLPRPSALAAGADHYMAMTAPVPELVVTRGGQEWQPGQALDAGWSPVGTLRNAAVFTLRNAGGAALTITGIGKFGENAADFSLVNVPITLAPGATQDFTVTMTPSAAGVRIGTVQLLTNAPARPAFQIPVFGRTPMHVSAWGFDVGTGTHRVPQGLNNAIAVAAGGYHSLALRSDGTVAAWGNNEAGQTNVPAGLNSVTAISAGGYDSLALRSNGTVAHWGARAASLPAGLTGVKAISAGAEHFLALKTNGTVVAWGSNVHGESTVPAWAATSADPGSPVAAVSAGYDFSAVLRLVDGLGPYADGWGSNDRGQISGIGGVSFAGIDAGGAHVLALRADGTVRAWGANNYGQATVPAGLAGVREVSAGGEFSMALKLDGTLAAWGLSEGVDFAPAGFGRVGGISAGPYHALGLTLPFPDITVLEPALISAAAVPILTLGTTGLTGGEVRTLTLINDGAAPLTGLAVSLSGTNPADFTITQPPVTTLAPGAFTTCTVRFTPASVNGKTATLNIASNDPNENPFRISLQADSDHTPIQAWRVNWWSKTEIFNAGRSANSADGDRDGLPNFMEFAFGTVPVDSASGRTPLRYSGPAAGGGTLTARGQPWILYERNGTATTVRGVWIRRKNHAAAGLVYTPEFAANPNAFTASTATPQVLASDANYDAVAVTFPATVPGGLPRFFRVRVTIPNPD